jgi:hypothetical protein
MLLSDAISLRNTHILQCKEYVSNFSAYIGLMRSFVLYLSLSSCSFKLKSMTKCRRKNIHNINVSPSHQPRCTRHLSNPKRRQVAGNFKTQNCNLHSQILTKKIQLKPFVRHENMQYNAVALTNYMLLSKRDSGLSRNKPIHLLFMFLRTYLFFI